MDDWEICRKVYLQSTDLHELHKLAGIIEQNGTFPFGSGYDIDIGTSNT
jgi:hypothetical protein